MRSAHYAVIGFVVRRTPIAEPPGGANAFFKGFILREGGDVPTNNTAAVWWRDNCRQHVGSFNRISVAQDLDGTTISATSRADVLATARVEGARYLTASTSRRLGGRRPNDGPEHRPNAGGLSGDTDGES